MMSGPSLKIFSNYLSKIYDLPHESTFPNSATDDQSQCGSSHAQKGRQDTILKTAPSVFDGEGAEGATRSFKFPEHLQEPVRDSHEIPARSTTFEKSQLDEPGSVKMEQPEGGGSTNGMANSKRRQSDSKRNHSDKVSVARDKYPHKLKGSMDNMDDKPSADVNSRKSSQPVTNEEPDDEVKVKQPNGERGARHVPTVVEHVLQNKMEVLSPISSRRSLSDKGTKSQERRRRSWIEDRSRDLIDITGQASPLVAKERVSRINDTPARKLEIPMNNNNKVDNCSLQDEDHGKTPTMEANEEATNINKNEVISLGQTASVKFGQIYVSAPFALKPFEKYFNTEQIHGHFEQFGHIVAFDHPIDKASKQKEGFFFVTFEDDKVSKNLISVGSTTIKGIELLIKPVYVNYGKIFVGAPFILKPLDKYISTGQIYEHFGQFGNIISIYQPINRVTQQKEGYFFVTFSNREVADNLINAGATFINGFRLKIGKTRNRRANSYFENESSGNSIEHNTRGFHEKGFNLDQRGRFKSDDHSRGKGSARGGTFAGQYNHGGECERYRTGKYGGGRGPSSSYSYGGGFVDLGFGEHRGEGSFGGYGGGFGGYGGGFGGYRGGFGGYGGGFGGYGGGFGGYGGGFGGYGGGFGGYRGGFGGYDGGFGENSSSVVCDYEMFHEQRCIWESIRSSYKMEKAFNGREGLTYSPY